MGFPGMGGTDEVNVVIGGEAPLVGTLTEVQAALEKTAGSLEATAGAAESASGTISTSTKTYMDVLKAAADQMNLTTRSMQVMADVSETLGSTQAGSAAAWLQASTSASEYGAKLDYLAAQVRMVTTANEQLGETMGGGFLGGMSGAAWGGLGLIDSFGEFTGAIGSALAPMMGFITNAGAMVAGLVGFSVLNDVIQQVQDFTTSLIDLNIATEKNQYAWRYLYGGGNNAQGAAIAQQMADWTKSFSMQIPYTRQDLLNATTNLAPLGLSAAGLEHYMPMIADLAATRDPNANLAQVAQVIMSASMGYTRMLKYDLKINPEDLIQYGLNATGTGIGLHINDPSTLLPALQNYANAKHLTGAAKDISTQTWWGAWSSFIDRIQNFELDTGHGLFGSLKTALTDLSSWIDQHHDQINAFAAFFSDTLTNAFKTAAGAVGDFMQGLGQSGFGQFLNMALGTTQTTPNTPEKKVVNSKHASRLVSLNDNSVMNPMQAPDISGWQQAGQIIGGALELIGDGWHAIAQAWSPLLAEQVKNLGRSFDDWKKSLTPEEVDILKKLGAALLSIPWALLTGLVGLLAVSFESLSWWSKNVIGPLLSFASTVNGQFLSLVSKATTWGADLIKNFILGINSQLTGLANAMEGVGGVIASHLHHSKPEKGPLANDDEWMPDMMRMWIGQIRAYTPQMERAMNSVAQAMASGLRPNGGYLPAGSMTSGGGGPVLITINGSSTMEVMKIIDNVQNRRNFNASLQMRSPSGYGAYTVGTFGGLR